MTMNEYFETATTPVEGTEWCVDLKREEFIDFRLLLARVNGPLRLRVPTLIMVLLCCVALVGMALADWLMTGREGYPDPVMLAAAALVLLPGLFMWFYVPARMKKTAGAQYDRSVEAGVTYYGRLQVFPDCIEKVGDTATAHIPLDDRVLFIETRDMMVFTAAASPALVLPARCMTDEMALAVRRAADRLPANHRRFIDRLQPQAQPVVAPPPREKPEELWVSTFTYTPDEYAAIIKNMLVQQFWKRAPFLVIFATLGALALGWTWDVPDRQPALLSCIVYFCMFMGVPTLFNLILPLVRVKSQVHTLSPHDMTMQVRMDTMMLRFKVPKGGEIGVLWCDVDHVYDKDAFVEVVHNKYASLHIPKRVIENIEALDGIIKRCRGKQ